MCGRFALNYSPSKLAEYFHIAEALDFAPSFNIAPSSRICTITAAQDGGRHLHKMRWGLIPSWAKDATVGNKLANARGETVGEKPSFRNAFKYRRCIIPVSGFYEWKTEKGVKYPYYISFKSGEPMAFAGLWEIWRDKNEKGEDAEKVTCCIITTGPNAVMGPIHDRMPVILPPEQFDIWLSPQEKNVEHVLPLIRSHEAEPMQAWPVTRELNKVGLRDDAGLVEPLAG